MKKLTALVLAFMLVFAAGSALALTDRTASNIDGQVIGGATLNVITMSPFGFAKDQVINWTLLGLGTEATYALGQDVIFLAQFLFASSTDDLTALWNSDGKIKITLTNMAFKNLSAVGIIDPSTNKVVATAATFKSELKYDNANSVTVKLTDSYDAGRQLNVVFVATITGADPSASVQAAWGPGMSFSDSMKVTTASATAPKFNLFELTKGKYELSGYQVAKTTASVETRLITDAAVVAPGPAITIDPTLPTYIITAGAKNLVIVLKQDRGTVHSVWYSAAATETLSGTAPAADSFKLVTRSTGVGGSAGVWNFQGATVATSIGDADFVKDVFEVLGFDWKLNGAIWDEDFLKFANFTKDAVVLAPNMQGAEVPVDPDGELPVDPDGDGDGDIDVPPITGDMASTFGFVMIGVAILATASLAVVAKKAR